MIGTPLEVCCGMDGLRRNYPLGAVKPEIMSRFAIISPDPDLPPRVLISTYPKTSVEGLYHEIGRVGVLLDNRYQGGDDCILLVVHCPQLSDQTLHTNIADVAANIMNGQCTDMMLASMLDLASDSRVTLYATSDRGQRWKHYDVTRVLNDFLLHDAEQMTVRNGNRVARMSVGELLECVIFERPAVGNREGFMVEDDVMLVHFRPPGSDEMCISVYSSATSLMTVYGSDGAQTQYDGEGGLLLNRRTDTDIYPYWGIYDSGNYRFTFPLESVAVQRLQV